MAESQFWGVEKSKKMRLKTRILQILGNTVQNTKSVGDKTKNRIQSVLHIRKGRGKKKTQLLAHATSQLQLLPNEFVNDDEYGQDSEALQNQGMNLVPTNSNSSTSSRTVVVLIEGVRPSPSSSFHQLSSDHYSAPSSSSSSHPRRQDSDEGFNSGKKSYDVVFQEDNGKEGVGKSRIISTLEQLPLSIFLLKLGARMSVKNLKKSTKTVRKVLTRGVKAMGNSMVYSAHPIPMAYECPTSYVEKGPGTKWDEYDEDYEADRKKYMAFWSLAMEQAEREREWRETLATQPQWENHSDDGHKPRHQFQL